MILNNIFRIIFILIIGFNLGFAKEKGEEVSTKNDIRVLIKLIKSNQEATNKRFEMVDKQFDDMQKSTNKRFEFMQSLMFALLASIFGLIGYSIYDRKKVIKDSKYEFERVIEEKLIIKADKRALDRVISIIEELAKVDEKVKDILNKHNLAFKG